MQMLSDDDIDLRDLSDEELARAWDLWFDLAQTTNADDPDHSHGVFQPIQPGIDGEGPEGAASRDDQPAAPASTRLTP